MNQLRQKNKEFSNYYSNFPHSSTDLEWHETALRHTLMKGLFSELPDFIVHHKTPKTIEVTVKLLLDLDIKIRDNNAGKAAVGNVMGQFRSPNTNQSPSLPRTPLSPTFPATSVPLPPNPHFPEKLCLMDHYALPPVSQQRRPCLPKKNPNAFKLVSGCIVVNSGTSSTNALTLEEMPCAGLQSCPIPQI